MIMTQQNSTDRATRIAKLEFHRELSSAKKGMADLNALDETAEFPLLSETSANKAMQSMMLMCDTLDFTDTDKFLDIQCQLNLSPTFRKFSEASGVADYTAAQLFIAAKFYWRLENEK